jgi:hypothetical protein
MISDSRQRIETKNGREETTALPRVHRRQPGPVVQTSPRALRGLRWSGDWLLPSIRNQSLFRWQGLGDRGLPRIRRRYSDGHEIRIPSRPTQRLLFRFEKPVDDERIFLERGPARVPRSSAADDGRSRIDRDEDRVGEGHSTAVRNVARIDRAMAGREADAGRTDMASRPAIGTTATAGPINGDACEKRLLAGKPGGGQEQDQNNGSKGLFHSHCFLKR